MAFSITRKKKKKRAVDVVEEIKLLKKEDRGNGRLGRLLSGVGDYWVKKKKKKCGECGDSSLRLNESRSGASEFGGVRTSPPTRMAKLGKRTVNFNRLQLV